MATKRELKRVANNGNEDYSNGEYRCSECGEYHFTCKHAEGCKVGALIQLIENSDLE
jgi:hypothetical protein